MVTPSPLPQIRRVLAPIRLRIISTSKDPTPAILIQNIRVEKMAPMRIAMSCIIRAHRRTRRRAHRRIIRLCLRERLRPDIRAVGGGRVDGRVAEAGGAPEAGDAGRRGQVVGVGAGDHDVELGAPLPEVGGGGGGEGGAEEGALDAR
jgi:hypothetical protein